MKIYKLSFIALAISILLSSCGGTAPIVTTPINNIDTLPLKESPLTDAELKTWGAADIATDTIPGMSVNKAYSQILKNKKGATVVIVAVIDSGVDIEHEDLKNVIWVNKGEIPNNGKDDDNNGYIDDVHGWNFLGDIVGENLEFTRIIRRFDNDFNGKNASEISEANKDDYALYQKAKAEFDKKYATAASNKERYTQMLGQVSEAHKAISAKLGKEDYSKEDLSNIKDADETTQQQIGILSQMLAYEDTIPKLIEQLDGGIEHFTGQLEKHYNTDTDFRGVLGDNPYDISDSNYGNNDVDGPTDDKEDVLHGTHVAGIIAAQRGNSVGMDGVASNVKIMVIRAVPDGDEYDKDVALAIRYAVDNGAKVINASFGKGYSQNPEWVWDAIEYASQNDVLIVHAAGNDGIDNDTTQVYPSDQQGTGGEISDTFITIGALHHKYGSEMVASFSNYGATSVDVFAPGTKIWSTTPLSTYQFLQGTSMASPGVAGVAAVIRSYYPNLSAKQVKQILMNSGVPSNTPVILGGEESNVQNFSEISTSGKMVNLYNALIMAEKMSK